MNEAEIKELANDLDAYHTRPQHRLAAIELRRLSAIEQQRTWVGLTDEDIQEVRDSCGITHHAIKTIEAKLKEKNT